MLIKNIFKLILFAQTSMFACEGAKPYGTKNYIFDCKDRPTIVGSKFMCFSSVFKDFRSWYRPGIHFSLKSFLANDVQLLNLITEQKVNLLEIVDEDALIHLLALAEDIGHSLERPIMHQLRYIYTQSDAETQRKIIKKLAAINEKMVLQLAESNDKGRDAWTQTTPGKQMIDGQTQTDSILGEQGKLNIQRLTSIFSRKGLKTLTDVAFLATVATICYVCIKWCR